MNASDHYAYSNRAVVDQQAYAMEQRIVAERRSALGGMAARREAAEAVAPWQRKRYNEIDREVVARWGIDA